MQQLNAIPELSSDFSNQLINVYNENGSVSNPTDEMLQTLQSLKTQGKIVYTILQNKYGTYYPYFSKQHNVYPEEAQEGYLKTYGFFEGISGTDESTMIIGKTNGIIKNISLDDQIQLLFSN